MIPVVLECATRPKVWSGAGRRAPGAGFGLRASGVGRVLFSRPAWRRVHTGRALRDYGTVRTMRSVPVSSLFREGSGYGEINVQDSLTRPLASRGPRATWARRDP
jgi:hypothetical protein